MNRKLLLLLASLLFSSLVLSACGGGTALPTETPTPSSGGGVPADSGTGAGSGPVAGSIDATTGLTLPAFAPAPSGAAPSRSTAAAFATIWIDGGLPLVLNNGECATIDGGIFVVAPAGGISPPPNASLVIEPGEGTNRVGTLTWAISGGAENTAGVTMLNPLQVTLNADGVSGSFTGTGYLGNFTEIAVTGVFNCSAPLVRIGGDHPLDVTDARCEISPAFVLRAGSAGGDSALLMFDEHFAAGATVSGGISWHVGGVSYTSNWLSATINPDGLSGSYYGEATDSSGVTFTVEGTFNCLGS